MLADFVRSLTLNYDVVGIVGRNQHKLKALTVFSDKIVGIQADYLDKTGFQEVIESFVETYGKPELIVSWVHSTSASTPLLLAQYCTGDFYDINGSSAREPSHMSRGREPLITKLGVKYHRVILGQIDDRWLTNDEISGGVREALKAAQPEYIVGT